MNVGGWGGGRSEFGLPLPRLLLEQCQQSRGAYMPVLFAPRIVDNGSLLGLTHQRSSEDETEAVSANQS